MVFMPRVNDPDWTTLQYSINDRITEDIDKYIFTIQNSLQNCVNIMITILWNLSFEGFKNILQLILIIRNIKVILIDNM